MTFRQEVLLRRTGAALLTAWLVGGIVAQARYGDVGARWGLGKDDRGAPIAILWYLLAPLCLFLAAVALAIVGAVLASAYGALLKPRREILADRVERKVEQIARLRREIDEMVK